MGISLDSRTVTVAGLLAVVLCLLFPGPCHAAGQVTKVSGATSLGKVSAEAGKCKKIAAKRARAGVARLERPEVARRVSRRIRARVQHRCVAQEHNASQKKSLPSTQVGGDLVIGIDGGYSGWSSEEVEDRAALGAAITRHEWNIDEPVDDQDDLMEVAFGEVHTRVLALLGGNDLGDPAHYKQWVIDFIHRYGPGGEFWTEHPEFDSSRYAITSIELGNEPYFGEMSATEYATTVRPVLEEIHHLNLPVTVVLPSRVYGDDTSWM